MKSGWNTVPNKSMQGRIPITEVNFGRTSSLLRRVIRSINGFFLDRRDRDAYERKYIAIFVGVAILLGVLKSR